MSSAACLFDCFKKKKRDNKKKKEEKENNNNKNEMKYIECRYAGKLCDAFFRNFPELYNGFRS